MNAVAVASAVIVRVTMTSAIQRALDEVRDFVLIIFMRISCKIFGLFRGGQAVYQNVPDLGGSKNLPN
jgi:hypothetical protein